jgi:hypothetical protein
MAKKNIISEIAMPGFSQKKGFSIIDETETAYPNDKPSVTTSSRVIKSFN